MHPLVPSKKKPTLNELPPSQPLMRAIFTQSTRRRIPSDMKERNITSHRKRILRHIRPTTTKSAKINAKDIRPRSEPQQNEQHTKSLLQHCRYPVVIRLPNESDCFLLCSPSVCRKCQLSEVIRSFQVPATPGSTPALAFSTSSAVVFCKARRKR